MLQAVQVVRPALDAFYSSLSVEQKERFNGLDEDMNTAGRAINVAGLCSKANERSSGLPVARIEQSACARIRRLKISMTHRCKRRTFLREAASRIRA